jgi:hypothetical protein
MPTVTELLESRSTAKVGTARQASRVFIVDLPPDAVLLSPPPGLPIPVFDTFPGDATLRCTGIRADFYGGYIAGSTNQASKVIADYADRTAGNLVPPNPGSPGFASWSVSHDRQTISIPGVRIDPEGYVWSDPTTNQSRTSTKYERIEDQHSAPFQVIVMRCNVENFTTQHHEIMSNQTGTLHRIGSRWYQYEAGPCEQITDGDQTVPGVWTAEHRWIYDRGTIGIPSTADVKWPSLFPTELRDEFGSQVTMYPGQMWARPPFHGTYIDLRITRNPPTYFKVLPTTVALSSQFGPGMGWRLLPGMPNI